jgi:hypothetical protein
MATRKKTKSNEKPKYGDTRADGFRFCGHYYRTSKSGVRKRFENWASPSSFLKIRKSSAESSRKNKLKNSKKNKDQAKRWRMLNPEKCKNARLQKKFGISIDEYNKKLAKQKKVCAICSKSCSLGKNLAVDHCHASGVIRGLLCSKCNLGLGLFKDDIILLDTAKKYLSKYRKSLCEKQKKSPSKS